MTRQIAVRDSISDAADARLRQRLLRRAASASGALLLLGAGFAALDGQNAGPPSAVSGSVSMAPAASEIAPAPAAAVAAPASAAAPPADAANIMPPAAAVVPAEEGPTPAPAAVAPVRPEAVQTASADAPRDLSVPPVCPEPPGVASPVPPAETAAAAPAANGGLPQKYLDVGPPSGGGYMVQLGVFLDGQKAEGLRRELARKGYAAYLQSRVVLGVF